MDRTTCTIKSSVAVNAVSEISLFITCMSYILPFSIISSTSYYKQPIINFPCLLPVTANISKHPFHQDIYSVAFSDK